jgi:cysteine-rich repeat protein
VVLTTAAEAGAALNYHGGLRGDHLPVDADEEDFERDLKKKRRRKKKRAAAVQVQALEATNVCGNGVLEASEECDDKNTESGDGCSAACTRDCVGGAADGKVQVPEQCDSGALGTAVIHGCNSNCEYAACDGLNCNTVPNTVCTAGGFVLTLVEDEYVPAPPGPSQTATYVYKICNPPLGTCSKDNTKRCNADDECKSQGNCNPTKKVCSNTGATCSSDANCLVDKGTCTRDCPVPTIKGLGLSHWDVTFPALGTCVDFPAGGPPTVWGTCECVSPASTACSVDPNIVLGDGSCFTSKYPVAKCDNVRLEPDNCIVMTLYIQGDGAQLGLGPSAVLAKAGNTCDYRCMNGPTCERCDPPPKCVLEATCNLKNLILQCSPDIPPPVNDYELVFKDIKNPCKTQLTMNVDTSEPQGSGCQGDPYKVTYTYTLTDDNADTDDVVCVQEITAEDTEAPTVTCPADGTANLCVDGLPSAPPLIASDNCDGCLIIDLDDCCPIKAECPTECTDVSCDMVNPFGGIKYSWKVQDTCGNEADDCTQTIKFLGDCSKPIAPVST